MSALPPIATTGSPNVAVPAPVQEPDTGDRNLFLDLMARANADQVRSDAAIESLVAGDTQDVHQVVMEVVKAEMSFQIFMEVRNQIVESYNELMRMQF